METKVPSMAGQQQPTLMGLRNKALIAGLIKGNQGFIY